MVKTETLSDEAPEDWRLIAFEDDVVIFSHVTDRDAIDTEELVLFMASYGYHLGYVIPEGRKFQFRRAR